VIFVFVVSPFIRVVMGHYFHVITSGYVVKCLWCLVMIEVYYIYR